MSVNYTKLPLIGGRSFNWDFFWRWERGCRPNV